MGCFKATDLSVCRPPITLLLPPPPRCTLPAVIVVASQRVNQPQRLLIPHSQSKSSPLPEVSTLHQPVNQSSTSKFHTRSLRSAYFFFITTIARYHLPIHSPKKSRKLKRKGPDTLCSVHDERLIPPSQLTIRSANSDVFRSIKNSIISYFSGVF